MIQDIQFNGKVGRHFVFHVYQNKQPIAYISNYTYWKRGVRERGLENVITEVIHSISHETLHKILVVNRMKRPSKRLDRVCRKFAWHLDESGLPKALLV